MERAAPGLRSWYRSALLFFAIAATIGAMLRLIYVVDMPWLIFKPWLHAHSHVAMLGWVFPALVIAVLAIDDRKLPRGVLVWLALAQLLVAGMLFSFPVQGYGQVSIACSVGHMIVAYVLLAQLWLHTRHWPRMGSRLLVRLAIAFQYLSTLGVWAMGPIMTSKLAGSEWYYWSIQWFLHFQFNGWFWFAAMAIGSRWAERHGVDVRLDPLSTVLWALSTVLTFALAVAWSERNWAVLAVNTLGVVIQFLAAWRTLMAMRKASPQVHVRTTPMMRVLIGVMLIAMAGKVAAQSAVSVPLVASMALTLRNYVIGFVHLNTLGAMSALLFTFALLRGWWDERNPWVRGALIAFVTGFALSEVLLFLQGTLFWAGLGLLPGYYWALFGASVLLPASVWILVFARAPNGGALQKVG